METNSPQFPLFIPSKGRSEYMITSKVLTELGVPHHIVVEPQEVAKYQEAVDKWKLKTTVLELDMSYKEKYDLCDDLGLSKSTGSGPARNFIWDTSISMGYPWHWIMDDNIRSFHRLNLNEKVKVSSGAIFRAMEDFMLRYKNVSMGGPNYHMFAAARSKQKPFIVNTRIYSCNLIRNDVPFRWRGRYNEDVILSLDMLKGGWCTVQFNAFLQNKMQTQSLKGGNTQELYQADDKPKGKEKYSKTGTIAKSQMLVREHPDVARIAWRFQRWHHHVDYSPWKDRPLVRREGVLIGEGTNNYGMSLKT
jgi:hypothetical protein